MRCSISLKTCETFMKCSAKYFENFHVIMHLKLPFSVLQRGPLHPRCHPVHVHSRVDVPPQRAPVPGPVRDQGSRRLLPRLEPRWLRRTHQQQELLLRHHGEQSVHEHQFSWFTTPLYSSQSISYNQPSLTLYCIYMPVLFI